MTGVKVGKMGKAIGTPPALGSEDGDGNGREHRFCFVPRRTQT